MKKFVSMAMVAAMTTSMVPATAFAGDDLQGTAKVVNVWKVRDTEIENKKNIKNVFLKWIILSNKLHIIPPCRLMYQDFAPILSN